MDVIVPLPHIGPHSNHITKRLKSCVEPFHSFVDVKVIFKNSRCFTSLPPYKDLLNRWQLSKKVIYKASCWDCNDFSIGKTKRRLHDHKMESSNVFSKRGQSSAIESSFPEAALFLVNTENPDLWECPTPEVRDSQTARHSTHVQSQIWQTWLAECETNFLRMLKKIGPGQRSRFLVLTKRSAASGNENVAIADHA